MEQAPPLPGLAPLIEEVAELKDDVVRLRVEVRELVRASIARLAAVEAVQSRAVARGEETEAPPPDPRIDVLVQELQALREELQALRRRLPVRTIDR